ncbi:Response regulator c-di-GMP phosphodiesterase, RpfG family, contains REC and HD-GYP domains [Pseudomonas sp. 8Z]|uniref:HD domain-containing phosphohydrolase n=1 Tax=Pseudomonas sp. 8Z TaxID=2653166 RepID=UPI0012EF050C|nr:HD domain-containing phosphohydrolase [Pseudomonas sp. 8Z]VXC17543.1 Response regulator c-di-GMP phosphodiesterase, RpfG family, contains REC and HD-GYP domains [Pseudomonas sp. 8Z]
MSESQADSLRPRVLLVDDEENILNSLRRLLRGQPYDLVMANGGAQALQLFEAQPFDLVVSDARMPGMDGATLLAEIHRRSPQCMSILLTGYADIQTIITAINEGQIYRYLSKPWNDDELLLAIRQALAFQFAERERERLQQLTQEQNTQLAALNESLEMRVQARTAELQQTADMLDLAYDELRRSYVLSTEVFSLLVNQRLPREKQTNQQIIAIIRAMASEMSMPEDQARDLSMAAALYNIGKLSLPDSILVSPADLMHSKDRELYRRYPAQSESVLMALEPLHDAAKLIRHHQERWDGSGFPDHLRGTDIPLGSRMLKLAVDFVELQCGLVLERRLNRDEALLFIGKYSGRLYDPDLIERFVHICVAVMPDITLGDPLVRPVDTRQLVPGMVLARNLHADNGMLLLNEGKVLSELLIRKLVAFEGIESASYTLFVRDPETAALQVAKE